MAASSLRLAGFPPVALPADAGGGGGGSGALGFLGLVLHFTSASCTNAGSSAATDTRSPSIVENTGSQSGLWIPTDPWPSFSRMTILTSDAMAHLLSASSLVKVKLLTFIFSSPATFSGVARVGVSVPVSISSESCIHGHTPSRILRTTSSTRAPMH